MAFTSLSLLARSERLGITSREYVALAKTDKRIADRRTLSTDGAVQRLSDYIKAGSPEAHELSPLCYAGTPGIEAVVRETLLLLPLPVRWSVLNACVFVGCDRGTAGFHQPAFPALPSPTTDRVHLIALSRASEKTLCHEVGHFYSTSPAPAGTPRNTICAREMEDKNDAFMTTLATECIKKGTVDKLVQHHMRPERIADAAASCWLGSIVNTCQEGRTAHIRKYIYARAESAESAERIRK